MLPPSQSSLIIFSCFKRARQPAAAFHQRLSRRVKVKTREKKKFIEIEILLTYFYQCVSVSVSQKLFFWENFECRKMMSFRISGNSNNKLDGESNTRTLPFFLFDIKYIIYESWAMNEAPQSFHSNNNAYLFQQQKKETNRVRLFIVCFLWVCICVCLDCIIMTMDILCTTNSFFFHSITHSSPDILPFSILQKYFFPHPFLPFLNHSHVNPLLCAIAYRKKCWPNPIFKIHYEN